MSWDRQEANFVIFDNNFASRLRQKLTVNLPRIPKELHDFVRPKERLPLARIEHNWGDFMPYSVSTVIRIYGFSRQPHVLPFNIPMRMGFTKVMWQIWCIQDKDLKGRGKGTIFPNYTIIPYFVILKGGYEHFDKFFAPYHLGVSIARHSDLEGLYNTFKTRIKGSLLPHEHNFPKDIIRNEFDSMT